VFDWKWQLYCEGFAQRCEHIILGRDTWHIRGGNYGDDWLDWCQEQKSWLAADNNLDIPSAEVLENALADFDGTMFVISHDRYFLDRVAERIVELDGGALTEYLGCYSDYQTAKAKTS